MKLSANTLGMLVFTAIATTAFVWMAKRPATNTKVMQFGMPLQSTTATKEEDKPRLVDENTADDNPEEKSPSAEGSAADASSQANDEATEETMQENEKPEDNKASKEKPGKK